MPSEKITKRTVDNAEPRVSRYTIFDSAIPGFGLRVYESGQKSWVFEYRPGEGGRRAAKKRITIGRSTDFTPDQARKRADQLRSSVKMGSDPAAEKTTNRQALTLKEVCELYTEGHLTKLKPRTAAMYQDVIDRIIVPELGSMKAKDVRHNDVSRLHINWKHTPYQANRTIAILSGIYSFANGEGGSVPLDYNPTRKIKRFREKERTSYLTEEQLIALGETLTLAESTGIPFRIRSDGQSKHVPKSKQATIVSPHAVAAIRLLIFTGARLREILHLEWHEVHLDRGLIILDEHKSDGAIGIKSIVLNAPAIEVLEHLPRLGRFVIASDSAGADDEKPRADLKRPWSLIRSHAGLDGVRIHDLRHNFGSTAAGGNLGLPIIGKLLGHARPTTTSRYAHVQVDPERLASEAVAEKLRSGMTRSTKVEVQK